MPPHESPQPARRLDDVQPIAQLHLGSHQTLSYQPGSGRMVADQQHRAGLVFVYAGCRVHGKAKVGERLASHGMQATFSIARQPAAEQALRQTLLCHGFRTALRQSLALPRDSAEMFDLPTESAWLKFVQDDLPELRRQGWQIVVHPGFAYDLTPIEGWYARLDESGDASTANRFELDVGIVVGDQRLSLLPALAALSRRTPAPLDGRALAERTVHERLRITLERVGGRPLQVVLPLGHLHTLLGALGEHLRRQSAPGPVLRLARADAACLATLAPLELPWEGGAHLRTFALRLQQYRQHPVAAPDGLRATLRPYQLVGLGWMQTLRELQVGGILGDDMGLGKTLQSLAHLLLEKQAGRLDRPALVVMPTSLIPNWQDEAARFAPQLRLLTLHGPGRRRNEAVLGDYDLLLTTYALLPRDIERLERQPLHALILDEAQHIKNPGSKVAQAARRLVARQRLCLTGTPLENHLGELWSLFHFLMPGWLGDAQTFQRDYRTPIENQGDRRRLDELTTRIRPFLLRRRKEDVVRELPAKTEIVQWVELSAAQRERYESVRQALENKVREEISRQGLARSQIVILDALLKLRQVCCDLRLIGEHPRTRSSASGKLDSLLAMLEELLAEGRRVLLFSQFTSMLALIADELRARRLPFVKITGQTEDRRTPVQRFQNGEVPLFLISLKAGGTGLNLTAADTVIHYDPWWNPAAENQATDRAYRIGQDKPVFVYKLIARGTVEEKIQQMQQRKAELANSVLERGNAGDWPLERDDLDALLAPLP